MSGDGGGIRDALWNASEGRLRTPWRLALAGFLVLALVNALSVVAVAVAQLGAWLQPTLRAAWVTILTAVTLAVAIAGVLAIAWLVDGRRLADLGLERSRRFGHELAVGAILGATAVAGTVVVAAVLGAATVSGLLSSWMGTFALTSSNSVLNATFWLVVFLAVGFTEEVLFRGYVLVNVAEGLRGQTADGRQATVAGVLASAGLFGVLHVGNPGSSIVGIANVVAFGLVLGATVAVTGRLALAIGVHVAWNVTLGLGFGIPVSGLETGTALVAVELSGPAVLTGGSFGPEGGLLAVAGLAVAVAGLAWWLGRRAGGLEIDGRIATPQLRDRPESTPQAEAAE